MSAANWIALVSGIGAVASAFIAYLSQRSAKMSADRSELALKAKIFIDLRERWQSIRKDLRRYELDGVQTLQPSDERWDIHELYWQHAFTEWYVTTHIYPEFSSLWHEFFSHVVCKTLRSHEPLRFVACYLLIEKKTTFGKFNEEFRATLEKLKGSPLSEEIAK